jgi:hypothetical protein
MRTTLLLTVILFVSLPVLAQTESDFVGEWYYSPLNVMVDVFPSGVFYWQEKSGTWRVKDNKLEAVLSDRRLIFSLTPNYINLIYEAEYWGKSLMWSGTMLFEKFKEFNPPKKEEEKPKKKKKKKQH